jgi:hypothetical protein
MSIAFIIIIASIDMISGLKQWSLVVIAIGIVAWIVADGIRLGAIFRLFGIPSISSFVKMWSLDVVRSNTTDAGYRLNVLHWAFFIAQWWTISITAFVLTHELVFLLLCVFLVQFFAGRAFTNVGMPPSVFILARSGAAATKFHKELVESGFAIFRIVSMLEHGSGSRSLLRPRGINWIYFGNLRTESSNDWEAMVRELIQLSPIIVLDMRATGGALEREADLICESGEGGKVFLLIEKKKKVNRITKADPTWLKLGRLIDPSHIYEPGEFIKWFGKVAKAPRYLPSECRFR